MGIKQSVRGEREQHRGAGVVRLGPLSRLDGAGAFPESKKALASSSVLNFLYNEPWNFSTWGLHSLQVPKTPVVRPTATAAGFPIDNADRYRMLAMNPRHMVNKGAPTVSRSSLLR